MCNPTESESGQLLTIQPCGWYVKLQSDRDHLAGVVKGMEEQNARNAKELHWHNQRLVEVMKERDALRQEAADWRSAKYIAEQKETAVHLALNDMRKERDALLKVREAADALVDALSSKCKSCEEACNHCGFRGEVKAYKEARDGMQR